MRLGEREVMPAYWSPKDERMYKAIKASCLAQDARRTRACPRMAAATVNKQRRKESRTLSGLEFLPVITLLPLISIVAGGGLLVALIRKLKKETTS